MMLRSTQDGDSTARLMHQNGPCLPPSSLRMASSASRVSSNSMKAAGQGWDQAPSEPPEQGVTATMRQRGADGVMRDVPKPGGFLATHTLLNVPKRMNCTGSASGRTPRPVLGRCQAPGGQPSRAVVPRAPYLIFQVPLLQLGVNASDIYSSCLRVTSMESLSA